MTFDEIVSSITYEQIAKVHLLKKLPQMEKAFRYDEVPAHREKLAKDIEKTKKFLKENQALSTPNDTLTSIAYFARIIQQVHPAWEHPEFNKEEFKKAIEKLYNAQANLSPDKRLKSDTLLTEFFKITATTLQDNHLSILNDDGKPTLDMHSEVLSKNHPKGTVGANVALTENLSDVFNVLAFEKLGNKPLLVAQKEYHGKKIGIIALSTCALHFGSSLQQKEENQWRKIVNTFKENYQNWDNIIIDVRGNTGGTGEQLQEIAQTLYGNEVPYCQKSEKRKTKEANLQEIGAETKDEQEEWQKREFKNEPKNLFILMDKRTGSAAEAIVPMLKDYPNVQFVGENTCGCCQYGGCRPIALPCGGWVNIGSIFRYYTDGMIECEGHKPTINCSGMDAYQVALNKIINPNQRSSQAPIKVALLNKQR